MIKAAIFDIDGTLLDSMPIWQDVGRRYLRSLGIEAKADLEEKLDVLSLPEGVDYIKKEYGLHFPKEEMIDNIKQIVKDFYDKEAQLKPGAKTLVESLAKNNIPMIIATASDRDMAQAALERNEIWHFFTGMVTCEEAGAGKTSPKVFEMACEILGTGKEETWVFEDSLYAVQTAAAAGFPVCGVFDEYSRKDSRQIKECADLYVNRLTEISDLQELRRKSDCARRIRLASES